MKNVCRASLVLFLGLLIFHLISHDEIKEKEVPKPKSIKLEKVFFGHQEYEEIISTFKKWDKISPDLIEVGTYGKTTNNKETYFLKISNEYSPGRDVVLITSCIHGNEPLSTSTLMCFMANLIEQYGKEQEITDLINARTIYFVPVISPDTYPYKRHVDGVDPNRNFSNNLSVPPVQNLKEFSLKIKPSSVLSGHTYGRIFLIPWGDNKETNPNHQEYKRIATQMCEYSKYNFQRTCEMYNKPIFGTEIDWYHRHGAFSMVIEFGEHQNKATLEESKKEFEMTFKSILFFIKESTKVKIQNKNYVILDNYEDAIKQKDKVILVFGTDWCKFCVLLKSNIDKLKLNNYKICFIDADANKELKTKYNIKSMPTSIILLNKQIISKKIGFEINDYNKWLEENI